MAVSKTYKSTLDYILSDCSSLGSLTDTDYSTETICESMKSVEATTSSVKWSESAVTDFDDGGISSQVLVGPIVVDRRITILAKVDFGSWMDTLKGIPARNTKIAQSSVRKIEPPSTAKVAFGSRVETSKGGLVRDTKIVQSSVPKIEPPSPVKIAFGSRVDMLNDDPTQDTKTVQSSFCKIKPRPTVKRAFGSWMETSEGGLFRDTNIAQSSVRKFVLTSLVKIAFGSHPLVETSNCDVTTSKTVVRILTEYNI